MDILYSDESLAVCVKPVGLDSESDMPLALREQLGGNIFPLHRLDKNVGGVMVYARTKEAAARFSRLIQQGEFINPARRISFALLPENPKVSAVIPITGKNSIIKFFRLGSVPNTVKART